MKKASEIKELFNSMEPNEQAIAQMLILPTLFQPEIPYHTAKAAHHTRIAEDYRRILVAGEEGNMDQVWAIMEEIERYCEEWKMIYDE